MTKPTPQENFSSPKPDRQHLHSGKGLAELALEDFAYELPAELIAQEPTVVRDQSRLMSIDRKIAKIRHRKFHDLIELLGAGDVLVLNDTRVIPARLLARRAGGGLVQILLLRPEATQSGLWQAMATPLRKLKPGEVLHLESSQSTIVVKDIILAEDGQKRVLLDLGDHTYSILSQNGLAPLPPYIHRDAEPDAELKRESDLLRYQTVFASAPGAVAAPTAGLHFSEALLAQLQDNGVEICFVTLHVGPGTFKPITTDLLEHKIESEYFMVPEATARTVNKALKEKRRIIAVGTTSCRTLEAAGEGGQLEASNGSQTSLFIYPGHQFKIVSGLITNFHLSKSSLLVLVSAFAGHDLTMQAYGEAIAERYRFFSYGDAMIIL